MSPAAPASAVASLRHRTGVSISACKDALDEAHGDEEKAIELLRKKGMLEVAKKSGRDQYEGRIFIEETDARAALLLLKCETDFVARDDTFQVIGKNIVKTLFSDGKDCACKKADDLIPDAVQKLGENITVAQDDLHVIEAPYVGSYVHTTGKIGVIVGLDSGSKTFAKDVAMHAAAMNPLYVSPDDVPTDVIEKEKEIWKAQLAKEGKPPQIIEKIMTGKERKFREENALLKQDFVKEPGKTVGEYLGNAKILHYIRVEVN